MRILILIITSIIVNCSWSQINFTIKDAHENTVIPSVLMQTKNINTGEAKTYYSDETGEILNINACAQCYVKISAVGFEAMIDTIAIISSATFKLNADNLFNEVVVTAQYHPISQNKAVQKITIINQEQIENSGSNNLSDILAYQSGIRMTQDNILGSSLQMGGMSGQNVKILIDGVPIIGRQDGNLDLSQINLNNIERIELVEGPLSVNFGTNALGGTINLITKKASGKTVSVSLQSYYETIGNYNLNLSASTKLNKTTLYLSAGRNYFDGWSATDPFIQFPKSRLADTSRFKTWKPKEQYFADVSVQRSLNGWHTKPYFRYFEEVITNRGYPNKPYYINALDDYYATNRTDVGLNVTKDFKGSNFKAVLAYNQFKRIKNTYYKDLTDLTEVLSETDGSQDTSRFNLINLRANYNFGLSPKLRFGVGTDLNLESSYGRRIADKEQIIGDYAVFATVDWTLYDQIIIKPGLRYAYNTVYKAPIIPSLNLKWGNKKWAARFSVASGFRSPSLKELYFDFVDINHDIQGNPDLQSEKSMNYSLHLNWRKPIFKKSLFKIEYGAFYNDIQNLITLGTLADNSYTYINIGTYKTIGNQLGFSLQSGTITAQINGHYTGRYNYLSEEDESVDPYAFSPEVSSNITYKILKGRMNFNLFYKFNGPINTFNLDADENVYTSNQSGYHILDFNVGFRLLKKKLNLNIGAKNILNVQSINITGTSGGVHSSGGSLNAGRGISGFISLKYTLDYENKNGNK